MVTRQAACFFACFLSSKKELLRKLFTKIAFLNEFVFVKSKKGVCGKRLSAGNFLRLVFVKSKGLKKIVNVEKTFAY